MIISIGFGLGLGHGKSGTSFTPEGPLLIDGDPILVDTFEIIFA